MRFSASIPRGHAGRNLSSDLFSECLGVSSFGVARCADVGNPLTESIVARDAERYSLVIHGVGEWMISKLALNADWQKKVILAACMALNRLQGPLNKRTKYLLESDNNKVETGAVILSDRKSTRLNSSHLKLSRMPSSA